MSQTAKTTHKEETQELSEFSWDNSEKFFDVEPAKVEDEDPEKDDNEATETAEDEEEPKAKEPKEKAKAKKDAKVEEETETEPFKEGGETPKDENEPEFFSTLALEMKERKIFQTVEIAKDEVIDEEKFFELQDQEIENRVEEAINAFVAEIKDADSAAFLEFKKAGGKTSDFFAVYSQAADLPEVDLSTEAGQDSALRFHYRNVEELDEADIEDKLDWLKETGKKAKYAEKYYTKLKEADSARKADLLVQQKNAQKAAEDNKKAFIDDVKSTLESNEQIGAFTITKNDKKELSDYITKPSVKQNNGRYLTQLQADLNAVFAKENREKLLLLAKLLKNNFDVSDVVKDLKTKVAKETKSTLQSQKSGLRPSSSTTSKIKSLADLF